MKNLGQRFSKIREEIDSKGDRGHLVLWSSQIKSFEKKIVGLNNYPDGTEFESCTV